VPPLCEQRWYESEDYRFGIDLFNHAFYWEAHEVFEALWHAAGRAGPTAELLQGLIKLCAACVKMRQGQPGGARKHGSGASAHFEYVATVASGDRYAGLALADLSAAAESFAALAATADTPSGADGGLEVELVPFLLSRRMADI